MAQQFTLTIDGERVTITLYSLSEYQSDGGTYDDSGNGGESFDERERDQFLCAATVAYNETGLADNDVIELAGLDRRDSWLDSVTGYFLLRDWPESAPLAARVNVGR